MHGCEVEDCPVSEGVFTDVVILSYDRQDHSIRLRWPLTGNHYMHTSGEASDKPNLINKCSSPVPQLSEIKMILCRSDGDSAGRNSGTPSKTQLLKAKVSGKCNTN